MSYQNDPQQPQQRPGPYAPYTTGQWQMPQPPKKSHRTRNILLSISGGFVVLLVIAGIASGGKGGSDTAASNATTAAQQTQTAAPATSAAAVAQAATQASVPAQVTYKCTGSAPDGIDIMYGPEGSSLDASHLPFTKTMSLDTSAQYFSITAQLSGSGHVTCTTTVQADDGTQTVKTASASGGYNIAMAEVCESFDGSYEAC